MIASARPVMIAAGGTGGHVIPALEVARVLRERDVPVVWIGTRRGLEAKLVPAAGISIEWLSVEGLRGKGVLSLLSAPIKLLRACWQASRAIRRTKPRAVLGMGGFVAGPAGLMAKLVGTPLVVHEQNAVAGLTNRLLRPIAARVLQAMEGTFTANAETVGNPVRRELSECESPASRMAERTGPLRLLVVGGSQGARALNQTVPEAVLAAGVDLEVYHQCGNNNRMQTEAAYAGASHAANIRVAEFIEDMPAAYAWADLVVCRSGAMTVAELAAIGVAAILVPFPYAVDDHQTVNARQLSEADAAILCPQDRFSTSWLSEKLREFSTARPRLLEMAGNAGALARPASADRVADVIMEVAK